VLGLEGQTGIARKEAFSQSKDVWAKVGQGEKIKN
jgi:hypothetical protein